jgi:hypothetical protein
LGLIRRLSLWVTPRWRAACHRLEMRAFGAVLGLLLVITTTASVLTTLVIPRGRVGFIRIADHWVDAFYHLLARPLRSYERRDDLLASQAAITLGVLLVCWLAAYLLGYGLLLWPHDQSFSTALREAGSSLFTLGFAASRGTTPGIVDFIAAATGMTVVALQIAYLPTLYSAYNRRETEVTLLGPRAGSPAWGPEILARFYVAGAMDALASLYIDWERWSADVAESHSNYPSLLRFRSPDPYSSWIVSELAMLDSAALYLAVAPSRAPVTARLCLQMGFTCLRRLGRTLHMSISDDPRPDDPIELTREEFEQGWQRLVAVGFPLERSFDEAWAHFRAWRVNYESIAYRLAWAIDTAPALWSGPRRHGGTPVPPQPFIERTPDAPDGARPFVSRPAEPTETGPSPEG